MGFGDFIQSWRRRLDPAPSSIRATGAGSQASMRAPDSEEHPFPRQGDRHAVRGDRGESVPDPLAAAAPATAATPPEPFFGDPQSLKETPTERYTSEPIAVEQDSRSDSG